MYFTSLNPLRRLHSSCLHGQTVQSGWLGCAPTVNICTPVNRALNNSACSSSGCANWLTFSRYPLWAFSLTITLGVSWDCLYVPTISIKCFVSHTNLYLSSLIVAFRVTFTTTSHLLPRLDFVVFVVFFILQVWARVEKTSGLFLKGCVVL